MTVGAATVDAEHTRHSVRDSRDDRAWLWLTLGVLLSVTVLQRFAVPGSNGLLGLGFVVCFGLWLIALLSERLAIHPTRLLLYIIALSSLIATLFLQGAAFSMFSLAMLAILYLPFVTCRHMSATNYILVLEVFQRLAILCSLAGLLQFALQFPFGLAAMFPLDTLLSPSVFIQGFNLQIPIADGSSVHKSTGYWFLEPSHLSQLLAFAIIVELCYFRRFWALGLFAVAYLVSFSGTGVLLLLAIGLPLIVRIRQFWLFVPIIAFFLVLPFAHDVPPFSIFLERLDEIDNPMASGSMRFLAPYWLVGDVLLANPTALLFGFGPGNVETIISSLDYMVQDSSWLKMLVEYGLLGTIGFFAFYLYALFRHSPDRLLSAACLMQFLFLGGYLNAFYVQFLHMALVVWPNTPSASARHV